MDTLLRRALQANHVLTQLGVQGLTGTNHLKMILQHFLWGGGRGVNILRICFKLIFKYSIKFINNIN